jgi:hypothetical protein
MTDLGNEAGVLAAKAAGAAAGAGISLIYLLPRDGQEAASRFFTSMCCGLIFGGPVGFWLVERMGISDRISTSEVMLTGSAAASLSAWWVMGALARVAARYGGRRP